MMLSCYADERASEGFVECTGEVDIEDASPSQVCVRRCGDVPLRRTDRLGLAVDDDRRSSPTAAAAT